MPLAFLRKFQQPKPLVRCRPRLCNGSTKPARVARSAARLFTQRLRGSTYSPAHPRQYSLFFLSALQLSKMQLGTGSPLTSTTSVSAAARARSLLASTSIRTGPPPSSCTLQPSPLKDTAYSSSIHVAYPARFDDAQSPLSLSSLSPATSYAESSSAVRMSPAAAPTPSQRARSLISPLGRESGGETNAAAPRKYVLSVQTAAGGLGFDTTFSGEPTRARTLVESRNSSGCNIHSISTSTDALARRLLLSKSRDLWFGPQLQLALEETNPSHTVDYMLLPWIISNCSRCIHTIVATTTASARMRPRPMDAHTLAVMHGLLRFALLNPPTCFECRRPENSRTPLCLTHTSGCRLCSGDAKQLQQRYDDSTITLTMTLGPACVTLVVALMLRLWPLHRLFQHQLHCRDCRVQAHVVNQKMFNYNM